MGASSANAETGREIIFALALTLSIYPPGFRHGAFATKGQSGGRKSLRYTIHGDQEASMLSR
jgi:hypothetical protein